MVAEDSRWQTAMLGGCRRHLGTGGEPGWDGDDPLLLVFQSTQPLFEVIFSLYSASTMTWVLPEKFEEGLLDENGAPLSKRCDRKRIAHSSRVTRIIFSAMEAS